MNDYHPSLLGRIFWRMLVVGIVVLLLLVAALQGLMVRSADNLRNQALEAAARRIAARLSVDGAGVVRLRDADDPVDDMALRFVVLDASGRVRAASEGMTQSLRPAPPAGDRVEPSFIESEPRRDVTFFSSGPHSLPTTPLGAALVAKAGDVPVEIQVVEEQTQRDVLANRLIGEFFQDVGWLLIPGLSLLLFINLLTIDVELRPLRWASELAADIGPRSTKLRIPEAELPKEVYPLIRAVNLALDRLDEGFRAQRDFTADAAHELRTPLAVLQAHVATIPDAKLRGALQQDIEAMSRIVAQLLRIAQLETLAVGEDERADLHAVAVEVATHLAPLAVADGRSIAVVGVEAPVTVRGNTEALGQAVRNLVENALRHTAAGTTVEIELTADRVLTVTDCGPGIPPAQRDRIFQRFWRADRSGAGGAGLGLAIVERIVAAHNGTVTVEDAPGGGARFVLRLPPATGAA